MVGLGKSGSGWAFRDLPESGGRPKPVFVNIITTGLPKLATAGGNDRMKVESGAIKVRRYRVGG